MDAKITALHACYCAETHMDLPLRMGRDRAWFDFDKAGFDCDDLRLVIRWIQRQIKRNEGRNSGYSIHSLRFSNLLQLDNFEERLLMARQEANRRKVKPKLIQQEQQ